MAMSMDHMSKNNNAKPAHSYSYLITTAIQGSPNQQMTLNDIYEWVMEHYPWYKTAVNGWKVINLSHMEASKDAGMGKMGYVSSFIPFQLRSTHFWGRHNAALGWIEKQGGISVGVSTFPLPPPPSPTFVHHSPHPHHHTSTHTKRYFVSAFIMPRTDKQNNLDIDVGTNKKKKNISNHTRTYRITEGGDCMSKEKKKKSESQEKIKNTTRPSHSCVHPSPNSLSTRPSLSLCLFVCLLVYLFVYELHLF